MGVGTQRIYAVEPREWGKEACRQRRSPQSCVVVCRHSWHPLAWLGLTPFTLMQDTMIIISTSAVLNDMRSLAEPLF